MFAVLTVILFPIGITITDATILINVHTVKKDYLQWDLTVGFLSIHQDPLMKAFLNIFMIFKMMGGVKMWCPYYKDGEYKCDLCNNSVSEVKHDNYCTDWNGTNYQNCDIYKKYS